MIAVHHLSYQYTGGLSLQFPDFTIAAGQQFLLLGDSGSGKTTLLHLIGGLLRNYSGSLKVEGTELSGLSESSLDHFRGQKIGFVFQKNHLISSLDVEKNLALSSYLAGVEKDQSRIESVLTSLGLADKRKSKISQLSQGQAQRVAIARAVLNKPQVILADEPTSALDDDHCEKVIQMLLEVAHQNQSTLVVATHDQRLKDIFPDRVALKGMRA
jgi:putative ABC transport system ATP-binding protein